MSMFFGISLVLYGRLPTRRRLAHWQSVGSCQGPETAMTGDRWQLYLTCRTAGNCHYNHGTAWRGGLGMAKLCIDFKFLEDVYINYKILVAQSRTRRSYCERQKRPGGFKVNISFWLLYWSRTQLGYCKTINTRRRNASNDFTLAMLTSLGKFSSVSMISNASERRLGKVYGIMRLEIWWRRWQWEKRSFQVDHPFTITDWQNDFFFLSIMELQALFYHSNCKNPGPFLRIHSDECSSWFWK